MAPADRQTERQTGRDWQPADRQTERQTGIDWQPADKQTERQTGIDWQPADKQTERDRNTHTVRRTSVQRASRVSGKKRRTATRSVRVWYIDFSSTLSKLKFPEMLCEFVRKTFSWFLILFLILFYFIVSS